MTVLVECNKSTTNSYDMPGRKQILTSYIFCLACTHTFPPWLCTNLLLSSHTSSSSPPTHKCRLLLFQWSIGVYAALLSFSLQVSILFLLFSHEQTFFSLFACVNFFLYHTLVTFHSAAPNDLTFTRAFDVPILHVVTTTTTDGLAAVVLWAYSPLRSGGKAARPAEAGWIVHVHKLATPERGKFSSSVGPQTVAIVLEPSAELRLARGFVGVGERLKRVLILSLENGADGMKGS